MNTKKTSIRLPTNVLALWKQIADRMGLSMTQALIAVLREKARRLGIHGAEST